MIWDLSIADSIWKWQFSKTYRLNFDTEIIKFLIFQMWTSLKWGNLELWPFIIFPRISFWPQFAHKSSNLHNIISNLYCSDNKNVSFILYIQKYTVHIEILNIKQYNFEISLKGTVGNLYQIVLRYRKYKNQYDNFWDQDHLCLRSHPCLSQSACPWKDFPT